LENRGSSPEEVFNDTVQVTMGQHHFRARPITPAVFSEVDIAKSYAFFKDRFADAGDFTFVFVGNVQPDSLKPLAEQYLATLPTKGRKETWKNVVPTMPRGVIDKTVRKGTEPKAATIMAFTGPFVYTPENRFMLRALTEVFQIKLNETLREQLGGTYSPGVGASPTRVPNPEYMLRVEFESSPQNVETLTKSVLALIDTMKTRGPSAADVEKVKEQMIRGRETELKTNGYWVGNISGRDQSGEDIAGLLEPYDRLIRSLTPAQVQQAARLYFDTKNYARFVLLPETIVP
jgi:zinc protease